MSNHELLTDTQLIEPDFAQPYTVHIPHQAASYELGDEKSPDYATDAAADVDDAVHESAVLSQKDSEALARVHAGDTAALGDIYERHYGSIEHYLRYRTGSAHLAEDLASQTFYRAALAIRKGTYDTEVGFNRDGGARPWLTTIARNLLADHYKSAYARHATPLPQQREDGGLTLESVNPNNVDTSTESAETTALEAMHHSELLISLRGLIEQLTPRQREVVMMRFFDGLRTAEVAEKLGVDEGVVKAAQYRAIGSLTREIKKSGNPVFGEEALRRGQPLAEPKAPAAAPHRHADQN